MDALGPSKTWEAKLSALFPGINFTVTPKADSKFKIVGAASVAAKVTRDAWIEGWVFEETHSTDSTQNSVEPTWGNSLGSGYPSGKLTCLPYAINMLITRVLSDPKTQAWIKSSLDPTFGFPSIVRFSWTTIKVVLEKDGHAVKW